MKITVHYKVEITPHEKAKMLEEARRRGYQGDRDCYTELLLLKKLLQRDGTSAIDSVPPDEQDDLDL